MPMPETTFDPRDGGRGSVAAETDPSTPGEWAEALAERLAGEMGDAWRQGICPTAEEYMDRHPDLGDHPRAAVRLIYEEVCLRQEAGQELASSEVVRRYS